MISDPHREIRLSALHRYGVLGTPAEAFFDEVTAQAARMCETAFSVVTLLDTDQVWLKSVYGCEFAGLPVRGALSLRTIQGNELFEVADVGQHPEFAASAPVLHGRAVRFFAGMPLLTPDGVAIGTLCVLDHEPKTFTPTQRETLSLLARLIMSELNRRESVQALTETHRKLHEATRIARLGHWHVSLHSRQAYWSDVLREILGVAPDHAPGLENFLPFVHPEDRARLLELREDSLRGSLMDVELRIVRPDGEVRWVHQRACIVPDYSADGPALVGSMQDITERKGLSRDLDTMFEHTNDIITILGPDGNRRKVNPAYTKQLGWTCDDVVGQPVWDRYHPEDRDRVLTALRQAAPGTPLSLEFRVRAKSGEYRTLSCVAVVAVDGTVYAVSRDVTGQRKLEADLQNTVTQLRDTLESTSDCVIVLDPNYVCTYANPQSERLLGKSLQGRHLWDEYPEEVGSPFELNYRQAFSTGTPVTFEEYLGTISCWLEVRAFPHPGGLAVFFRDITDTKRASEALRATQERMVQLAAASRDALWDYDLASGEVWRSEGYNRLFGYPTASMGPTASSWSDSIHPEDRNRVVSSLFRTLESGAIHWSEEYRFRRYDGTNAQVYDRATVLRDANGRATRMVGAMTDFSDRYEAERRIREQAALIDQARDAILVRRLDGTISLWNSSAAALYGYSAQEAIGRSVAELIYDDQEVFEKASRRLMEDGAWSGELRHRSRSGETVLVDARWTLLRDAAGVPQSILSINTDITEKKQLEVQFQRAQRMESVGVLAGGIAHDLNNMLTPLLIGTGLLKERLQDPAMLSLVGSMEARAQKGANLIRQVLTFAHGLEGESVTISGRTLLQEFRAITLGTLPSTVTLEVSVDPALWDISGDPAQLHQMILSLCRNAADAMPDGGAIRIRAVNQVLDASYLTMTGEGAPGPYVLIEVSDEGHGIPEELHDRIFHPFYTTKRKGEATGLGLSNTLAIVKGHGGLINFHTELGKGSTFRVFLPAIAPQNVVIAEKTRARRGQGQTILVIDDEPAIRNIAHMVLEADGYRVLTAEDGADGVALYSTHREQVAAVLTDMMMPILGGATTIFALRRMNPALPIIASSGLGRDGLEARALEAGACCFLHKPYTAEALLDAVAAGVSQPTVAQDLRFLCENI